MCVPQHFPEIPQEAGSVAHRSDPPSEDPCLFLPFCVSIPWSPENAHYDFFSHINYWCSNPHIIPASGETQP